MSTTKKGAKMTVSEAERIKLDDHFRADSSARVVAERLLTGRPQTRQELVDGLGISVTTVNRVVELLTEAGATIVRDVADDGRQARFRVVDVQAPRTQTRFPSLGDELEIVGAWRVGEATMIDLKGDGSVYRGELKTLLRMVPLGMRSTVQRVALASAGQADVLLSDGEQDLQVDSLRNVT
jgi:biotin operon repressor